MPNPEGEQQFNIPEEKIREFQRKGEEQAKQAEAEGMTPLSEVFELGKEELKEEKRPLEPSKESLLLIEGEGRSLTNRQQELLKIQVYFLEQQVEKMTRLLGGEHKGLYGSEDREELTNILNDLTVKYEDILDRQEEYPAAREIIDDIRDYLSNIEKEPHYAQPISLVWRNIVERLSNFHQTILSKETQTIEQKQNLLWLSERLRSFMLLKIPKIVPGTQETGMDVEGKKETD